MTSASPLRLFSDRVRVDPRPAGHAEADFDFLDRVDQPYWARIRNELERWYAAYPAGEAGRDLRNRFRKADLGQHYGAWWELYLHRFFTLAGWSVEVHPQLDGSRDRPDFRLASAHGTMIVEAATTFSGIDDGEAHSALEPQIMDAINQGKSDNFTVSLEFAEIGTTMPRVREITGPIEHWLAGLDPDHEYAVDTLPQTVLPVRDWALELTAYPTAPQYRGQPTRLLAGGPVTVGSVDTVDKLRATLDRKARKYGEQSEPFVIAVLMPSTFANLNAVEKALFGDTGVKYVIGERGNEHWVRVPNGFWMRPGGPRAAHVSAVITGFGILPGEAIATRWPRLWPNPHADRPVGNGVPLPRSAGSVQAQFIHDEERDPPAGLLGLEDGWPGPEAPFVDDD